MVLMGEKIIAKFRALLEADPDSALSVLESMQDAWTEHKETISPTQHCTSNECP